MKDFISIAYHSLKNHGPKMVLGRFFKYSQVKVKRLFRKADKENLAKWQALKGKYEGKRVFVMGNGPSLNKTPLYLLKNEYTLCFNHIDLMFDRNGWIPNFYMVSDDLVIRDIQHTANNEILPNVDYGFFPDLHPYNINFQDYIKKRNNVLWINTDKPGFSKNLPYCGINRTVVNGGLQIMAYLGFKEIYLLGVDASIAFSDHKTKTDDKRELTSEEDDPNHFDPRYFSKGKKYHYQPMYEMVEKLKVAKVFLEEQGIKINNAGVNGQLEVFKRQPLEDILAYPDSKKERLFLDAINKKMPQKTYDEFIKDATRVTSAAEFIATDKKLVSDAELGVTLIPKAVLTHIPFGPYKNSYVFIKRDKPIVLK